MNLKNEVHEQELKLKEQENIQQKLRTDQVKREKAFIDIQKCTEPNAVTQMQETTQRLQYMNEKLEKIDLQIHRE